MEISSEPKTSGAATNEAVAQNEAAPGVANSSPAPDNNQQPDGVPETASQSHTQTAPTATANQHAFASQFYMASSSPTQGRNAGSYNMANMASALPQAGYRAGQYAQAGQQRYNNVASPPMMHQMPQMHPQFAGHPQMQPIATSQGYYVQQPHMPQFYGSNQMSPTQSQAPIPPRQPMPYYPNQMVMNHHEPAYYYAQPGQYPGQAGPVPVNMMHGQYMPTSPVATDHQAVNQSLDAAGTHLPRAQNRGTDDVDGRQSAVRGPPRKPRQSGHAIWIGNLPPQTDLMNLVHHVCKEAPGLVSLFLISKSNCAFANFKDEPTCVAAQQKLHDSRFQGIRLVSRLRKSTVEGAPGVTAPTGPAATSPISSRTLDQEESDSPAGAMSPGAVNSQPASANANPAVERTGQQDKFFILKSLTMEDLELSVQTGVWATQSHNENTLNNAFKTADNVYLVFSANKSGEYFGYARMISQIDDDPAAAIEFSPKAQATNDLDLPKAIPTEATEHTPRGKIMDDSARGSIFWEAERDESDRVSDSGSEDSNVKTDGAEEEGKTWGKPFKLEWLSTTRLPFYRTRGLRNPWNSNREVKIARDGTELEPSIGRRLIGLFNRVQSPGPPMPGSMRSPMGVMGGFSPNRPYGA